MPGTGRPTLPNTPVSQESFWDEPGDMLRMEAELHLRGYARVAGLDEAGRGPLAGPVVAAAVILPQDVPFDGLTDSKMLRPSQREYWFDEIRSHALSYSIASVEQREIDEINILEATRKAMAEAVGGLNLPPHFLLIDGTAPLCTPIPQQCVKKGDRRSRCIAAASVLAKVTRDRLMEKLHESYPIYNFKKNKGYGTREHLEALRRYGCCPLHRKSFRGVLQQEDKAHAGIHAPSLFDTE